MVNPDSLPLPDDLRDLLDRLRSTVEDFAAREVALDREHNLQLHRARESWEEGTTRQREIHDGRLAAEAERHAALRAEWEARAARRRDWIDRAHKSARNRVSRSLAEQEGHRVYQLQMEMIQQKRDLAAAREHLGQRHEAYQAELAGEREALGRLRKAATRALRGYPAFLRGLAGNAGADAAADGVDLDQLIVRAREDRAAASESLRELLQFGLPKVFASLPASLLVIMLVFAGAGAAFGLPQVGMSSPAAIGIGAGLALGGSLIVLLLHATGRTQAAPYAEVLVSRLRRCREGLDAAAKAAERDLETTLARMEAQVEATSTTFDQQRRVSPEQSQAQKAEKQRKLDEQVTRLLAHHDTVANRRLDALDAAEREALAGLQAAADAVLAGLDETNDAAVARLAEVHRVRWDQLEAAWREAIEPLYATVQRMEAQSAALFPDWSREYLDGWKAPDDFANAARLGALDVNVTKLAKAVPQSPRLALPGPSRFRLPISLVMPQLGSVLFESDGGGAGRDAMLASLNQLILRLLSVAPPAKLSFTIIDPVGLGDGFSGLMHLADYDESLISSRIWTQSQQIDARLGDLNDHIEKVIQMYLRNEFPNITEYNRQAGKIAEKYHFVVIADFPANFSELAAKRLLSIATSGARCGVYLLMHWDRKRPAPQEFVADQVRPHCLRIVARQGGQPALDDAAIPGAPLVLDRLPDEASLTNDLIHRLGAASRDAERVQVPFKDIAPAADALWSVETTKELRVPIGRTGATKLQYLAIGRDTRQHALIAGKTGSGKSTLFHVMITNLSLWCSPDEVEFYLVDFKKGVEFKCYANARLPHARVIAIESDREFGLSVLQRLDDELKRRGDLFRQLGVQDLPGYEKAGGREAIPRTLLLIDEFQEFFVEDDRIAQNANVLLDRIVRQGRAFGIHVILGSQTLGGAYTLARTTLGQMVIRIALQCNEADAYLIMDDSNPAPRLLTRPGEGIYNDQAGMIEGNSPFQVVWLSDEEREDWLRQVSRHAAATGREFAAPIVFEGNAPADIRENAPLRRALAAHAALSHAAPEIHWWLGAPNAIKGPTQAVFQRQSGNHLLIVGQRDEAALTMFTVGLIGLSAQFPAGGVRFVLLDSSAPETPEREHLEHVAGLLPHPITVARGHDLETAMADLAAELDRRQHDESASATAPAVFLLINGLQRIKKLKYEEDFSFSLDDTAGGGSPGTQLNTLIAEGPALGIHVVATCDTYNNLNRMLSRKALSEFEMRVLFQMSANDSASLIDSPKASGLGLHRALFYNEQEGYLETFRPYAQPDRGWFEEAGGFLK